MNDNDKIITGVGRNAILFTLLGTKWACTSITHVDDDDDDNRTATGMYNTNREKSKQKVHLMVNVESTLAEQFNTPC